MFQVFRAYVAGALGAVLQGDVALKAFISIVACASGACCMCLGAMFYICCNNVIIHVSTVIWAFFSSTIPMLQQ
jgi:hypothetical protein